MIIHQGLHEEQGHHHILVVLGSTPDLNLYTSTKVVPLLPYL